MLRSRLRNVWYRRAFQNKEVKFPHVQKSHLNEIPIARVFSTTREQEKPGEMEALKVLYREAMER